MKKTKIKLMKLNESRSLGLAASPAIAESIVNTDQSIFPQTTGKKKIWQKKKKTWNLWKRKGQFWLWELWVSRATRKNYKGLLSDAQSNLMKFTINGVIFMFGFFFNYSYNSNAKYSIYLPFFFLLI